MKKARKRKALVGDKIVQDDSREKTIAKQCGLKTTDQRAGVDAFDKHGNPFELKSGTKSGITTARDVNLKTIGEWRRKYWIIARGRNRKARFEMEELYIVHPDDLESRFKEIESNIRDDIRKGKRVLAAARKHDIPDGTLDRVKYLIQRGSTLNNPKIPLALIREVGTELPVKSSSKAKSELKKFVKERPLRESKKK